MTIGEALAQARFRAGLTVDELSERTKIREAVIRSIERNDYAACGGDIYARGYVRYVRALAGAVGIDAQPLIRDFDAERAAAVASPRSALAQDVAGSAIATVPEPPTVIDMPAIDDPDFTIADPEFSTADPDFTVADPEFTFADEEFPPVADAAPAEPLPAAPVPAAPVPAAPPPAVPVAAAPAAPAPAAPAQPRQPSAWRARTRSRRWVTGVAILVVIALAVAGFAGSRIVSHLRQHNAPGNAATVQQQRAASQASHATAAKSARGQTRGQTGKSTAAKKPAHTAPKAAHPLAVSWLPVKLAMAFGPDGFADGDNPQVAQNAVTASAASPWQTDWYATPEFGMLKSGTGLLLDMGKPVTITSLRIDLSSYRGADLQLRLGDTPSDLRVATHADDVGGTVRLDLRSPLRARYVLIWFTLLPPNGAGEYQESVYRVVVNGLR